MSIETELLTRVANIAQQLAELDSTKLGGAANPLKTGEGTAIDHVGFRKSLLEELNGYKELFGCKTIAQLIEKAQGTEVFEFEVETSLDIDW